MEVEEPESTRGLAVGLVWGWMSGKRRKPLVLTSWWLLQAFCVSAALWPSCEQRVLPPFSSPSNKNEIARVRFEVHFYF